MHRSIFFLAVLPFALCATAFNPRDYTKKVARCPGLNRATDQEVALELHYVDVNPSAERTMLMLHGWPSLWSTWKYQIDEFKDDYRLIIPDSRGFGESTHPGDVKTSGTMPDLVDDLSCILRDSNVAKAICVGHDWGTQVCYEAARTRPDLIEAVVGIAIPYVPSHGPFTPIEALVPHLPRLAYQLAFSSNTQASIEELSRDVRRTLRGTLRTVDSPPPAEFLLSSNSFMEGWKGVAEIPPIPFFTPDEEDYMVEQYFIQRFNHTLYFYQDEARYASWKAAQEHGEFRVFQPVLSILPTQDPVADWVLAASLLSSAQFLPDLEQKAIPGAHWVHIEHPVEVNAIMREWLGRLGVGNKDGERKTRDEL
ncbi:alpha/beta-hydrolase [Amylostereum chailletii]|nr:alpha/beta-hydrolase [Amylostereum chailletii]